MNQIHGWGRFPRITSDVLLPLSSSQSGDLLGRTGSLVARGKGRSYGDSALAPRVLDTRHLDQFLDFDASTGVLKCAAGVSLADILRIFVPRGWFLPVLPGTRHVSVGGAIASDVHGKNHHLDGTFTVHIRQLELLLGNGERVCASATERSDLFHATCGGMGLTGIILSAALQLRPVLSSEIVQTTLKLPNLEAVMAAFEERAGSTYSVAWIDCLARGRALGRSLLMSGEHAKDGPLRVRPERALPVPLDMPSSLLNRATVKMFNGLYYGLARGGESICRTPFEPFFHPLDALSEWNRLYGRSGFLQYQFVLPRAAGLRGLRAALERISLSRRGSFLAVLKAFGPANANHLSFPIEGYTLALDFKLEPAVLDLLDELDSIVLHYGGRIYLTKDARMRETTFKASYPRWHEFEQVRSHWFAHGRFASLQSRRLGLQ